MSEDLNQNPTSNEEAAVVESVETPAVEAPVLNETEQLLSALDSQLVDMDRTDSTHFQQSADSKPDAAVTSEGEGEETGAVETDDETYDPQALMDDYYGGAKSNETEQLKETVSRLESQLSQLMNSPGVNKKSEERPRQMYNFISKEEYEAAMESPEAFNLMLNRVYYAALEHAVARSGEVASQVQTQIASVSRVIDNYYSANPDLKPHEELMSLIWPKVCSEHSGKKFPELIDIAGKEVRKMLKMRGERRGQLRNPEGRKPAPPAFARPSGGGNRGNAKPAATPRRGFEW